jgi:D-aminopeptidase
VALAVRSPSGYFAPAMRPISRRSFMQLTGLSALSWPVHAARLPSNERRRPRTLGVRIGRMPTGPWNAITDVPGVEVGHTTLISGQGALRPGVGPVRTGVTAIWPHREIVRRWVPCGVDVPNGNGETTGLLQARALGMLGSPICLTNTSNVGLVYDALMELQPRDALPPSVPVVGETWDAFLNDIEGRHVHAEHVRAALASARSGPVAEGCVGGGTGMTCYGFKGGIGTASRRLPAPLGACTVGALVQANHGERALLRIDGVPVGEEITDLRPEPDEASYLNSILMILATDVPLLSHQLDRLARRAVHGLARTGSVSGNSSGDITLAFTTANAVERERFWQGDDYHQRTLEQFDLQPVLEAAAEALDEAVINALFMATDMDGVDGHRVFALPIPRTLEVMRRHRRLYPPMGERDPDVTA